MPSPHFAKLTALNETLFHLLELTRRSLAGQGDFNLDLVHQLSSVLAQAQPILSLQHQLRIEQPNLVAPLDHYLRLAFELQSELRSVNVMLLSRRASLDSARTQLRAVSQFADALSTTS
jgi:hypothetical protein